MPTTLRTGPYRFFFFAGDRGEPPHVHVERNDKQAKFWLEPIALQTNRGFSNREINQLTKTINENQDHLLRNWNEYFND